MKLLPTEKDPWNMKEVPGIVGDEFVKDLNSLYGEVLLTCIKELKTSKLSLVSLKIMPVGEIMKITVNVNLHEAQKLKEDDKEPTVHRMVNFTQESECVKRLKLHRLVSFMKAKELKDHKEAFVSIMHLRIIRFKKDDMNESKF